MIRFIGNDYDTSHFGGPRQDATLYPLVGQAYGNR